MRRTAAVFGVVTMALAGASCSSTVRTGGSPSYLIINSLLGAPGNIPGTFGAPLNSSVVTNVITPPPCSATSPCPIVFNDLGQAQISLALKDIGTPAVPTTPSSNNAITITRYHVDYVRTDGLGTPGVDIPYPVDGGISATITGTSPTVVSFQLVRIQAKQEPPLVALASNGQVLTMIAKVTFYGADQVGNQVSVTGQITINFGNFANITV